MTTKYAIEALSNVTSNNSKRNFAAIFNGFESKGIVECDIKPRINIFTFAAWRGLGRIVKRGEKGIRLITFVPFKTKEDDIKSTYRRPRSVSVFHISQTEEYIQKRK